MRTARKEAGQRAVEDWVAWMEAGETEMEAAMGAAE